MRKNASPQTPQETAPISPLPPEAWCPSATKAKRGHRGLRPKGEQITNAVAAAEELQSSTSFAADFGATAPKPDAIAYTLTNASEWRQEWANAEKWCEYCREQRAAWENEAMGQMAALRTPFDYALSRDPDLATKYRATERFMDTPSLIGQRAAASRKAGTSKKKKAAEQSTASPTTPSAPPKTLS